jgi:protein gp37
MGKTRIEWADEVWNPVTGCTKISEGCKNCYAERMSKRLAGRFGYPAEEPFRVTVHRDRLEQPLRWRKPRRVFVDSMGDLFHEDVPEEFVYDVWRYMAGIPRHTFLLPTKRVHRMKEFVDWWYLSNHESDPWPNIWLDVSVENQPRADERIPLLLQTPAARRFVSLEPLLGPVFLGWWLPGGKDRLDLPNLDWVICGAETGPGAREMNPDWARDIRDQCKAAGVPFFMKAMSGGAPIPDDLNIQEFPS